MENPISIKPYNQQAPSCLVSYMCGERGLLLVYIKGMDRL